MIVAISTVCVCTILTITYIGAMLPYICNGFMGIIAEGTVLWMLSSIHPSIEAWNKGRYPSIVDAKDTNRLFLEASA